MATSREAEENRLFASTVIATIGRPTLARAVESVLSQGFPPEQLEVIVVNDSGQALTEEQWQRSKQVRIIRTNRRERSVARNTGAATAKGRYLHFLDDDDWLTPGAFSIFRDLSRTTSAVWLYGRSQLVDRQQRPIIQLHHGLNGNCFVQAMAGEWIPLQASLIEATTFFSVGGFDQTITGPEDIDLLRRITLVGDIVETPGLVSYVVTRDNYSTTDYVQHPEVSRRARENVLDAPITFQRLCTSAHSSYWRGRVIRLYLTSTLWNLKRRRLLTAASRMALAGRAMAMAHSDTMSPDLWRAIAGPYQSETFARGLRHARLVN